MSPSQGIMICLLCSLLVSATVGISFRNQPGLVTAYKGDTVNIKCDLYLDPNVPGSSVTVTWIKSDNRNAFKYISIRGIIVQAYADPTRYSISGDPNRGEHDLMITNLKYEDAGMFWCQVTSSGQLIESDAGRLTVQVPIPVPTCSMNPATPQVGERVTLTCDQEMHPGVNYEALNWWNDTSRTKMFGQRYSDGSIYFTRILTESDRNQRFICSQGVSFVEGQRNCTLTPLKPIEISTIATQLYTISISPEMKYVTERSSATFSCTSNAGSVTRWIFGYGSRASKIRDTRGRFLVSADRSELTVIRTTMDDHNTGVRCVVITPEGGKLIAHSVLTVLKTSTVATNPRIPLPPPPLSTPQPKTEEPTRRATTRPASGRKDTSTLNDPSTNHLVKTGSQSLPNVPEVMTSVDIPTTDKTLATELMTKEAEATTKRDIVQIGANPDIDTNLAGTVVNANLNYADSPKAETGGSYKAVNPHQVANTKTNGQNGSNSGVVGAVMGTLLIIALVVLVVFLIKTKRYPKTIPAWVPPQVIAALKRPTKKKATESANENVNNCEKSTSNDKVSMRMKQIEVVVNPPPPEWQFRLKDVELSKRASFFAGKQRRSQMPDGPVYANITPDLSKSHIEVNDFDDEDSDSLFSSDFDDDLDLEGEIAAEMAARSNETNEANETLEERKSKNVEGLVYAQLDLGPDAEKRSTVFIEGEKTEYAHIVQHGFTAREV